MRLVMIVAAVWLVASCGHRAANDQPPRQPAAFPLPPLSPTVVGALLDARQALALDAVQLEALQAIDGPLRDRHDAAERELEALRADDTAAPRGRRTADSGGATKRGGRGGRGGGGMRGGGGPGGGMRGGGGPGGGMRGGGGPSAGMRGGGMGGSAGTRPALGGAKPRPKPDAREARHAARERASKVEEQRDREQHDAAERALALLRPDQVELARAIVADYFARAAAPPRNPPSPDDDVPRPAGGP